MKEGIHPEYFDCSVECASCGNKFTVGSTSKEIKVTICAMCHPFFTGKQMLVDSEGRVERFKKKYSKVLPATKSEKSEPKTAA